MKNFLLSPMIRSLTAGVYLAEILQEYSAFEVQGAPF